MCAFSQSDHALPHWKCVWRCCAKFTSINIINQETYDQYPDNSPSIFFHIYHLIARCTKHGRLSLTNKESFGKCQQDTASGQKEYIYTRKELVMMEKTISNFHTSFHIPEIHKLEFHIPHVQVLGTNHCGYSHRTALKRREYFQDVLYRRDYADRVVSIFAHQIQSEYYCGNIFMSIEGIALENFSALPQTGIKPPTKSCPLHAVFNYFFVKLYQTIFCRYNCTEQIFYWISIPTTVLQFFFTFII